MDTSRRNFTLRATAVATLLFVGSQAIPAGQQDLDLLAVKTTNDLLVVRNMTVDFQSLGLGTQQAKMLAEQTADFGVLGMITTVAAIGLVTHPIEERTDRVRRSDPGTRRSLAATDRNCWADPCTATETRSLGSERQDKPCALNVRRHSA